MTERWASQETRRLGLAAPKPWVSTESKSVTAGRRHSRWDLEASNQEYERDQAADRRLLLSLVAGNLALAWGLVLDLAPLAGTRGLESHVYSVLIRLLTMAHFCCRSSWPTVFCRYAGKPVAARSTGLASQP